MCLTSTPTHDDGPYDGIRSKLLQKAIKKKTKPKTSSLKISQGLPAPDCIRKTDGVINNYKLVPSNDPAKKPYSDSVTSSPVAVTAPRSRKALDAQRDSAILSAQFVVKMKSKQMKSAFKGVGKELRRAASTIGDAVTDHIPTQKKNSKPNKSASLELVEERRKPQARSADEIKAAYGHSATDVSSSAGLARQKLMERQERLSALQRRTGELEAGASNFASLAEELARKMENRKWYEI